MQVKCQIDNTRIVKNGMKITLNLNEQEADKMLRYLSNFNKRPLLVDFQVDVEKQKHLLSMISPVMRKKIHAIFGDIADQTGNDKNVVKESMKQAYCEDSGEEMFSLSNCSSQTASNFAVYLVGWCFVNGIELNEKPREIIDDIEKYMYVCLKFRTCCICGKKAERHHVDAIGMGRDRNKVDDSENLMIALCSAHHTGPGGAHTLGWETFAEKHHVIGIRFNE